MSAKKIILSFLFAVYCIAVLLAYSTNIIPEESRMVWANLLYLIAPLFALAAGIYALRKYGIESIHGKTLLYINLGSLSFFIAELLWVVYEIFFETAPSPSIADIFFFAAYPFFLYGIFNELKLGKILWTQKKILTFAAILAILLSITLYFGVYSAYDPEAAIIENTVSIGYGLVDVVMVGASILLIYLAREFRGGAFYASWTLFSAGIISYWLGDVLYAIFYGQYVAGEFLYRQIDYLWLASYFIIGWALIMQGAIMDKIKESITLPQAKSAVGRRE